ANAVTQEFSRESGLDWAQAEEYKRAYGYVHVTNTEEPTDPYQAIVVKTARNVMTRLHQQVAQTIQYYRAQQGGSAPVRLFLAGGGASMLYTAEFFQEKLNLPVEFLNPFRNVELGPELDPEALAREAHSLGEMAGLGLRATTVGMTEFNLLPKREKISRQVDKRGPYAIATIFCAGLILYVSGAAHRSISAKNEGGIKKMEQGLGDFEKIATQITDVEGQLFDRKGKAEKMERILRSRFYWIELVNSIQGTLSDSDGKILILTNPNKLMPKGTNVVNQINAEKVAEADTAVWLQSLTITKPAGGSGGKQGGGFGSGEEMGGGGGIPSGGGGMGEGGMGGGMEGMGGMGGMGEGNPGEGSGEASKDKPVEVIYLKLMAKNVLADAANGEKVRTRETLNREFAQMMAEQFQNNEMFSDDATRTKVEGKIAMKEIDGTRWFEFVIQLTLKDPIVMKDKSME
ncbi:MAG: pilus assembly protein PilM, partial [Verrucomicrobia subdivision 3 bacterium]|nr:pilus assembly protein PilM [Limisphaerales bacterium]